MNNVNGNDAVVNKVTININAIASAEKTGQRTFEEELFDSVVNARYACTRFQRH